MLNLANYILKNLRKVYIRIINLNKNLLIFTPQIN